MKLVYHLSNLSKRLCWNYYWKANNEMLPYKYHHILKKQRKKKNPLKYNNIPFPAPPPPPPPIFIQTFLLMEVYYALIILTISDWKLSF